MSDASLVEQRELEHAVMAPAPARLAPIAPPATAPARPSDVIASDKPAEQADEIETISFGINPLIVAAAPLLQLIGRLRTAVTSPHIEPLREWTADQMRRFETVAREGGVPNEQLQPAHYALCAAIDDVVQSTTWGSQGGWGTQSLVSMFHKETRSGDCYARVLRDLVKSPANCLPVLELMYYCLSLGFLGQYRLPAQRPTEVDRIRSNLYATIATQRPGAYPGPAANFEPAKPVGKPKRGAAPVWAIAATALAFAAVIFLISGLV
jgi:type VI secretion system protein ImpK